MQPGGPMGKREKGREEGVEVPALEEKPLAETLLHEELKVHRR